MDDIDTTVAEQVFFEDPALDRMFGVIFRLAGELYLTRVAVQRTEALLELHGITAPDGADTIAVGEDRIAYVENILSPLLGRPGSRSAP